MRKTLPLLLLLIISLSTVSLSGQETVEDTLKTTLFNFVSTQDLSTIKIELDLTQLQELRRTNDYIPAKVHYKLDKKNWEVWDLEVRSRGKFRRIRCDFPPLKLNFSKKHLKSAGFKPFDEFKLVTHCLEDENGKEIVLREYLTYRLYRVLTDYSLRAHLAKILYKDTGSKAKSQHYGILLEPEKELRKRMGAKNCKECYNADEDRFHKEYTEILALFQYMIGNTDYSLQKLRNVTLMQVDTQQTIVPVPYDFDFCGLVDAPYAIPNPDYQLTSTRDRKYLGLSKNEEDLKKVMAHFLSKKSALMTEVENFDYLSKTSRKDIINYLEDFFTKLEEGKIISMAP